MCINPLPKLLVSLCLSLLVTSLCWAQASSNGLKLITLRSGSNIVGEINKVAEGYEIRARAGQVIVVNESDVVSIKDYLSPEQEYQERLAKIRPDNAADHYQLAVWANNQNLLTIAKQELQNALAIQPNYDQAQLLLRQVDARLRAFSSKPASPAPASPRMPAPGTPAAAPEATGMDQYFVTSDDINRVKVEEFRLNQNASVTFKNDLIKRFIQDAPTDDFKNNPNFPRIFRSWPALRQARYILETSPDNLSYKEDIVIKSEMPFMLDFRRQIWPIVSAGCATQNCHGAEAGAGGLKIFNVPARNDRVDYTNFLMLDLYSNADGKMIDREDPENSLLLRYGMSNGNHPGGQLRVFQNKSAQNYQRVRNWIDSLKRPLHPDYRLEWQPPYAPAPTTMPAVEKVEPAAATEPAADATAPK